MRWSWVVLAAGDKDADVDSITKVINLHTESHVQRHPHFKTAYKAFG